MAPARRPGPALVLSDTDSLPRRKGPAHTLDTQALLGFESEAIPLEITHAMPTLLTKMQAKPRFKLCVCVCPPIYISTV